MENFLKKAGWTSVITSIIYAIMDLIESFIFMKNVKDIS